MKKRYIIAEIIVWTVILSIIFAAAIFSYSKIFVEPNIYNIQFKDIDGITEGSPVRFMGMNVGYVRQLKSKDKYINVQIIVTQKNMKIPNGTVARVEFYGLAGSKSIELMPPDGSCNVGILTDDTIRIADIAHQAKGFVNILEEIEKYIKGLDKAGMQKFLETVSELKSDNIKKAQKGIEDFNKNESKTFENIRNKQNILLEKIEDTQETLGKLNKLIKR